ncbi:MAG: LPS assembly lipoprotein LptE [Puniceicoccales bacterium]|jgi:hypothetical protein|nr:LPS assembly lipoprotein LptE [Puniceicoccales bacterium]
MCLFRKLSEPFLLLLAPLCVLVGCGHYTLGRDAALPFQCIYVAPVENRSLTPELQSFVWQHIVQCLENSPVIVISERNDADAILEVILAETSQSILSTSYRDSSTADSYSLKVSALCTLRESGENRYFFKDRCLETSISIPTQPSYVEAKRHVTPQLAANLARKICNLVLYSW